MGDLIKRKKDAIESVMRETIYNASVKILLEKGLEGLTMSQLAHEAGVAKGTLYNYFKDKNALLIYIFALLSEELIVDFNAIRLSDLPPNEKFSQMIKNLFLGFEKNRNLLIILSNGRIHSLTHYSEQVANNPEYADFEVAKCPVEKNLYLIIEEGIEKGVFKPVDPTLITHIILGGVSGLIDRSIEESTTVIDEALIDQLLSFYNHGLMNFENNK